MATTSCTPACARVTAARAPRHSSAASAPLRRRRQVAAHVAEAPVGAEAAVEPVSPEVEAKLTELGIDFANSGLLYLSNDARVGG